MPPPAERVGVFSRVWDIFYRCRLAMNCRATRGVRPEWRISQAMAWERDALDVLQVQAGDELPGDPGGAAGVADLPGHGLGEKRSTGANWR